jgi:ABC-type nickel/cobalt efflux system permease component RcnA
MVSSQFRSFESDDTLMGVFIILGISFIYGVIHAAGPGHGKALVGFYFLKEGGNYKRVFKMGYLIAFIHATSALLFTFGVYYLLDTFFSRTFHQISKISIIISAFLIIIVGLYLLYQAYKHKSEKDKKVTQSNKSDLAIAFSAGVVPCPGVMTITLFSISLGHIALGVASAVIMSIGMGLTISFAGIFSVAIQKKNANAFGKYGYMLESFAALLIIGLGTFLLLGSLGGR